MLSIWGFTRIVGTLIRWFLYCDKIVHPFQNALKGTMAKYMGETAGIGAPARTDECRDCAASRALFTDLLVLGVCFVH